jgi:hypothetical protein
MTTVAILAPESLLSTALLINGANARFPALVRLHLRRARRDQCQAAITLPSHHATDEPAPRGLKWADETAELASM